MGSGLSSGSFTSKVALTRSQNDAGTDFLLYVAVHPYPPVDRLEQRVRLLDAVMAYVQMHATDEVYALLWFWHNLDFARSEALA